MTEIDVFDEKGKERKITTSDTWWMLFTGWMFYIIAQILNLVYYYIHPSSPEMCSWGASEELEEEWTYPYGEYKNMF